MMSAATGSYAPPDDLALDRRPPMSEEAELAVLSAVLLDERALLDAREILDESAFYLERHRRIFRAMCALAETGSRIDPLTLAAQLDRMGELEAAGGRDYLYVVVSDAVPMALHVRDHARIVREKADRRRLLATLTAAAEAVWRGTVGMREIAADLQATLLPVASDAKGEGFVRVQEDLWPLMESLEARAKAGGAPSELVVPTGYPEIDEQIAGGFERGDLVVVAGVPGGCKTAAATNIALNVVCPTGDTAARGAAVVSAEMTRRKLHLRNVAAIGRLNFSTLREASLRDDDYPRLARAAGVLGAAPLWVDETPTPAIEDIVAKSRALKAAHPEIALVVVDFIQLVQRRQAADRARDANRAAELTAISYALKGLAKELGVVVVATCQVDAADIEKRPDKRPRLGDARWSQGMREAADHMATCYRDKMYNADPMAPDTLELAFQKVRDAEPFTAMLQWQGQYMLLTSQKQRRGGI